MHNIVVIPAFCDGDLPHYAMKCINFWKKWCDKNGVSLYVIKEKLFPFDEVPPHIQKLYIYRILESQGIEYTQCLLADWDTFPMPNAKNIFDYTEGKFSICLDYGWATGLIKSIEFMSQFYNHSNVTWDNYFNSGLFVFNKNHKDIFERSIKVCSDNEQVQKLYPDLFHGDQTVLNYEVHGSIDTMILPRSFMVHDYFLDIFLRNYVDHKGQYVDSQQYLANINFVHITRDSEFRNQVVDLIEKRFYS